MWESFHANLCNHAPSHTSEITSNALIFDGDFFVSIPKINLEATTFLLHPFGTLWFKFYIQGLKINVIPVKVIRIRTWFKGLDFFNYANRLNQQRFFFLNNEDLTWGVHRILMVVQGCQRLKAVLKERRKIMEQLCTDWYTVWRKSRRQWTNGISHIVCAVTQAVHVLWSLVLPQELWEMFSQCSTSDSSQWEKSNRFTLNSDCN